MARTTNDIQQAMIDGLLAERPDLSPSGVAEWRLWTRVVASAIHLFEVLLDRFRVEMEEVADKVTPGTARWYADQCRRFQNGHELLFDEHSAQLYYAEDDPATRIIDVVAVTEGAGVLSIIITRSPLRLHAVSSKTAPRPRRLRRGPQRPGGPGYRPS